MRNAKLWSVLLAAVLLCACVVGMLGTGASASDSRIPVATDTYVVGTDGDTIRACLEKAAEETWGATDVLEIQFSGEDSSMYASPNPENGISGYTLFEVATIFREDNTKLPIVIRGMDEDKAALLKGGSNGYNGTNDYYFTNLTINGGKSGASVSFYAGSGKMVFENTQHNNTGYTYYYGDCQATDAFIGWDETKLAANVNEDGLLETGIVFGNGCTGLNPGTLPSGYDDMHFAAVGFNGDATVNPEIYALRRAKANVTAPLTEDEVETVKEAATTATFKNANILSAEDCIVKPWDLSASLVIDLGTVATVSSTTADIQYSGARKGVSPVREATIEVISGGVHYLAADGHNASWNETTVGDTRVIVRGGRLGGYGDVGIRLTNLGMHVGNLTFEIHEDDPNVPTYTPWIQTVANSSKATTRIFGDYYFLMTGGTIGKAVTSTANGYYGAPQSTGTVVNEIRGGQIWQFSSVRFGGEFVENTPISTVLPGTGETLTAKVAVHNIISGGTFGGVDADGVVVANTGYFVGSRDGGDENVPPSVCSEITGGTFYCFAGGNRTYSNNFDAHIYNFISGTTEKYPTFLKDFHGACSYRTTREVTNVIKGYPVFRDTDGTTRNIFGGTTQGTVLKINNYLSGMPVFNDFYGGCSGKAITDSANNNALVKDLYNVIALDASETAIGNYVWGGNGYYAFNGVDGATADAGNSKNEVYGSLVTDIYSGTFGTFRAESSIGTDKCDIVCNVYGGTWNGNFMAVNRTYGKTNNTVKDYTVYTNIYDGTFKTNLYMGGQNTRNQPIVNNVYGGNFSTSYNGGNSNAKNYGYYGGGEGWSLSVENNIYGGTFSGRFFGAGKRGANSVVNNLYGGTYGPWHDFMGASSAEAGCTMEITNNFYGGDSAANWIYGGNMEGSCGTITNTFYSGKDNPCRDPENELYKYYDAATMLEGGFKFRDQVICGGGYTETLYTSNTCEGITNLIKGGCFTKEGGSTTYITIHGGMRWGIINGDVQNDVITGKYYRIYGGSDYGVINGTITNNYGKVLEEGEEAPELTFYNNVGSSTSIGYVYGGGYDNVNFPSKISAALAVEEASRTAIQKMYASLAEGLEEGETYNCTTGDIVTNIYYGSFRQFYGGSYGLTTAGVTSNIASITNNIYGGTFTDTKVGSSTNHAYYGGCGRNANIIGGITNNVYGGVFNTNFYGGTPGSGTVVCPTIKNNFYGGEGCSTNKTFYLGNGAPTYTGTVHSIFYAADDNYPGFNAKKTYVYGGCSNTHNNTTAEYAVINEIRGGTFVGFWGIGGGSSTNANVNVKTVISGGVFNGYDNNSLKNSVAGATRNGAMNGNVLLEISGGVFNGAVVGGVIYGADASAADTINGNVTVAITGGEFNSNIFAVTKPGSNVSMAEGKTAAVYVTQTAGKTLKLGGEAHIDTFTANGDEIAIAVDTDLVIDDLTGALNLKQTEGWEAHDYLSIPAGSSYSITESPAIYGSYVADDTILVKGFGTTVAGATLRLSDRVGVRILLNKDEIDSLGDAFSYKVEMGETVLAEGTKADLVDYQGYYSFVIEGIGLNKFNEKLVLSSPFIAEDLEYSIADLAVLAQTAWAENAKWKAYADAVIELNNVYNLGAENTLTPAEVTTTCTGAKGEADDVASANVSLLMSDAAGLRLVVTLNNAPTGAKVLVNGDELTAEHFTVDGNVITTEVFFAHEYLAETFVISVQSDAGVHMTYTASIEALANELASDDTNENKDNATAFLCYIQKAVACK